jgi:hypothetical protein
MDSITISTTEYDQLIKDSEFLCCLQEIGVDNWCGYDDAIALYRKKLGVI